MNIRNIIYVSLLLGIMVFLHKPWFLGFETIIGSDWGFFYPQTMKEWFPLHPLWNAQLNFGYYDFVSVPFVLPYFLRGALAIMNIDFTIIDRVLYLYPVALLAPISMFLLCYTLTKSSFGSFVGALLYAINTYFLTIQIGHFTLALVYSLFPLLFLIFHAFLKRPRYSIMVLFLLVLFIAFSNEARVAFLGLFILVFYLFYELICNARHYNKTKLLTIGKFSLLSGVLFVALLSFITVPLFFFRDIGIGDVAGRGFFGADFFLLQNALTLFHPFWSGNNTTEFIVQPIPYYFWIIPFIAFASLLFVNKNKYILFFALLALVGVFLSKGITDPLGNIYIWLYTNIPGFSFFREPTKFYFIIAFSYAVLFAYFFTYAFSAIDARWKNKFLIYGSKLILLVPLTIFVFISKPAVQGTLGDAFRPTVLPKEYYVLHDFLIQQKDFFRTMYFPNRQRFELLTNNHPSIAFLGIPGNMQSIDPNILKLYSVKYVVLPYDSTNDIYRHYAPRESWESILKNTSGLKKVNKNFGEIVLYENTKGYLPHIFTGDNAIYVSGDASRMHEIAKDLPDKNNILFIAESPNNQGKQFKHKEFNTSYYFTDCIRCSNENAWENYPFPYARFLPDSPLYFYVKYKENKQLKALSGSPEPYAEELANLSLKRIVEVQEMNLKTLHIEYIKQSLAQHDILMNQIKSYLRTIDTNSYNKNEHLLKLSDSYRVEKKIIGDIVGNEGTDLTLQKILQNEYYKIDEIYAAINKKVWRSNDKTKRYILTLPEKNTSELFVTEKDVNEDSRLKIGNNILLPKPAKNGFISFGEVELSKGNNLLAMDVGPEKNLIATNEAYFKVKPHEGTKKFYLPIDNLDSVKQVRISYQYKGNGRSPLYLFSQNVDRVINGRKEVQMDESLDLLRDQWQSSNVTISTKFGASKGALEFWLTADEGEDTILQIKDLQVVAVANPSIIVKSINNPSPIKHPDVAIIPRSPTHYQAKISNAPGEYALVFNEQYHNGWKASINGQTLPETSHMEINGYANAWRIDKRGTYIVDIFFYPEKYYMIGIIISLAVLASMISVALIIKIRKNGKNI